MTVTGRIDVLHRPSIVQRRRQPSAAPGLNTYGGGMSTPAELAAEYDVIVLGMGPGGEEVAERLAEAGLQVLAVEPHLVGGECPYYGCIPSKMIVRAAETLAETKRVNDLAGSASASPDYGKVADRIRDEATDDWDDAVAAKRYTDLGGHLVRGHGRFDGRDEQGRPRVAVGDQRFTARSGVVVATGTAPAIPPIAGLAELAETELRPDGLIWTNREVVQIRQAPKSLVIIGGGAIGVEIGQALGRFGTAVAQLEAGPRILAVEEPEVAEVITEVLEREGAQIHTGVKITEVRATSGGVTVAAADGREFTAQHVLVAAGRRSHLPELGLDSVGLDPGAKTLTVDEHMQVAEGVFAVGDVTGRGAFTHVAVWQARVLVAHLLGRHEPYGGYHGLAWVTFTDPEVGRVGLTEQQARRQDVDVVIGQSKIAGNTRGWIHGPGNDGFVKLVADRAGGHLVGATVVAPGGGEILGLLTLAVHAKVPLATLASMHYAYPTLHRAISEALATLDLG
jgi:pyruvate/2-oxoglutarate dehydrogenase complex dihydrolipoamide dehydrogenase (E3) component